MRLAFLVLLTLVGCGQIAPTDSEKRGPTSQDPTSSTPTSPAGPSDPSVPPPGTPPSAPPVTPPPMSGACGVVASARSFATADAQAAALHGLWVTCMSDPAPGLCPASDTSVFFGAIDAQSDPKSRAVACGHLTTHGDGFIPNPTFTFTYEVETLGAPGSPPTYAVHVFNDTIDHTFVLTYREDAAMTGSGTITLGEPDGAVGSLRHSAFTTF